MSRFELSKTALNDLREIWEYVSRDSFETADRLLDEFYRELDRLAESPKIGHKRPDLTARNVLFWPIRAYLIIYSTSRPLRVVRILHSKRDIKNLLKPK